MNLKEWARKEVELAVSHESHPEEATPEQVDFGVVCFKSALHAFEVLVDENQGGDGALGLSAQILNQLINRQPLSPVDDIPENWEEISKDENGTTYRSTRIESLIRYIRNDGASLCTDASRYYCVDINNPNKPFHGGLGAQMLDEMVPITFPYQPVGKIRIFLEQFPTYPDKPTNDTIGVLYFRFPDGQMQNVNRFLKENHETKKWEEIQMTEYNARRTKWLARVEREAKRRVGSDGTVA